MRACRALSCRHPRSPMPEWFSHRADAYRVEAYDYADRSARERIALARARRENPGRATEIRRLDAVQRGVRLLDWRR